MEGLIPYVYRAIVQYKNNNSYGREGHVLAPWFNYESSPSASYMRLPTGDSGRFQIPDHKQLFHQSDNYGNYSSSSSSSSKTTSSQIILSTGVQSPAVCRLTSRRVVA